jgi:hypothetical protein
MNQERHTRDLPAGTPDEGKQLSLLLDTARDMVGEEIRRGDRLDSKSRNQFTVAGALFAVVMATTAGVLSALLDVSGVPAWVYPVIGGCALGSILALGMALAWSIETWRVRPHDALDPETLERYVSHAARGNAVVAKNLVKAYSQILRDRRSQNQARVDDLKHATCACGFAALASLVQLGAVFVALIQQ